MRQIGLVLVILLLIRAAAHQWLLLNRPVYHLKFIDIGGLALTEQFNWTEELSVGVEALDRDHQWLLKLAEGVSSLAAADSSAREDRVNTLLADFLAHTTDHFLREEWLMDACEYPGLGKHRDIHRSVKKQILAFVNASKQGCSDDDLGRFRVFAKNWILDHILYHDQSYAAWMRDRAEVVRLANLDFDRRARDEE